MITQTLSAPITLCLGITNRCNLSCKHCLASNTRHEPEWSTEELLALIDQIEKLKIFQVSLFGGEPLMRDDMFTVLERLSAAPGINLSLNTNGTLITPEVAKRLKRYPIRTYTVSLDGSCAQIQDPFRGKGSFDKNVAGIRNLIAAGCRVLISTIVTKFNYCDAENIVLLARKLGALAIRFNEVVMVGNAACCPKDLQIPLKERMASIKNLNTLRSVYGDYVVGSAVVKMDFIRHLDSQPSCATSSLMVGSCGAGTVRCAIRPDGWVTPCEILWDVKAGNVKEKSLSDIWLYSPVMQEFRTPIELKQETVPECRGCRYLSLCYTGHRCHPYYSPGELFEHKEYYCLREDVVFSGKNS
jgi:radical SAM protein with 4Fe4S-binding SPASM domain